VGGAAQLIQVRPLGGEDRALVMRYWGDSVVRRGEAIPIADLPGFVAELDGERAGLLTYAVRGDECEIVTLHSLREGRGVGRALMDAARETAAAAGCRRLWLVTTNDNVEALRFYQRRGFRLAALHAGAVDESRRTLKPEIPVTGNHGIPIRDEIQLELALVDPLDPLS
jgi:ribosomal protein S18 acetylase RimI-like enzyme